MRRRKQEGSIVTIGNRWYVRYWQRQNAGGVLERKRLSRLLGPKTTRGFTPPADIVSAAETYMAGINGCEIPVENIVGLANFVESVYLPWVKEYKRPSTYKAYRDIWEDHIKPVTNRERGSLKDTRTFTVQNWLNQIGKEDLSRNSLKHIKTTFSGIFTLAKQLGYFDGENPARGTAINPNASEPLDTYAYSLEEVQTILNALPEPAATIYSVAAFAGLRFGELAGLEWGDYHDGALWVSRSVWNGHVGEPKTKKSKAPVPVIPQLKERLEMHQLRCGNPQAGPIFANSIGGRLNINNLLSRTILPALNRCLYCGLNEGKPHLKQDHKYERDARIPAWHGWHAARRGLGSNLYRIGVPEKVIQAILRHSNVSVTMTYYVKTVAGDVADAMVVFGENVAARTAAQALRDSDRTLNTASGATPESVN